MKFLKHEYIPYTNEALSELINKIYDFIDNHEK